MSTASEIQKYIVLITHKIENLQSRLAALDLNAEAQEAVTQILPIVEQLRNYIPQYCLPEFVTEDVPEFPEIP